MTKHVALHDALDWAGDENVTATCGEHAARLPALAPTHSS